jgi:hypothetical protein
MSVSCQKQTHAVLQMEFLLDHLIGPRKQRRWDCKSERICSLEVDDQLEPRCLSQRQIARSSTSQDLGDLLSRIGVNFRCGRTVGHETAGICKQTERTYHGQVGFDGEVGQLLRPGMRAKDDVGIHEQCVRMLLTDHRELRQQFVGSSDLSLLQCDTQTRGNLPSVSPYAIGELPVRRTIHSCRLRLSRYCRR